MTDQIYDQLPYNTHARRDSHPSRLAALGRLFGLDTAAPENCTLFEIGCATGGNIIPMALAYPASRFSGIDLSRKQIELAQKTTAQLGLNNIRFEAQDIATYRIPPMSVDYIICHGVYSWVPPRIQDEILKFIRKTLKPDGLAYISYNVYPGWRFKSVLRDIMTFGSKFSTDTSPEEQLKAGCQFLAVVADSRANSNEPFDLYLKASIEKLKTSDLSYLFHEYLAPENSPCFFTEFIGKAEKHQLKYLSESKLSMMNADNLASGARSFLSSNAGKNRLAREQALDIFRNRSFRETLVCREEEVISENVKDEALLSQNFTSDFRSSGYLGDPSNPESMSFKDVLTDRRIELQASDHAKFLAVVGECGPRGSTLLRLEERFQRMTNRALTAAHVAAIAKSLLGAGLIEAICSPIACASSTEGTAKVSPYVKLELEKGVVVTSLTHRSLALAQLERDILFAADGTRSFGEIITHVSAGTPRAEVEASVSRLCNLGFFGE